MIQIDLQSRVPLYEQLQEQIIRLSMLGILDDTDTASGNRNIQIQLGVNPNTVAKAYQQLEQQGIIYTVSGRGSFVSPDVLSLQSLRQAALQEVLDAVDKALSRGVSPQQLLDAIRQQLDSLSPCNQGGTQDD